MPVRRSVRSLLTRWDLGDVTEAKFATLGADCPGWDYQTLHADFRAWIGTDPARVPISYQNAFIGFVPRFDARDRHTLGR